MTEIVAIACKRRGIEVDAEKVVASIDPLPETSSGIVEALAAAIRAARIDG